MLKNVTIGRKLAFVLGVPVLGMAALAGVALWGLRANAARAEDSVSRLNRVLALRRISENVGTNGAILAEKIFSKSSDKRQKEFLQNRQEVLDDLASLQK